MPKTRATTKAGKRRFAAKLFHTGVHAGRSGKMAKGKQKIAIILRESKQSRRKR